MHSKIVDILVQEGRVIKLVVRWNKLDLTICPMYSPCFLFSSLDECNSLIGCKGFEICFYIINQSSAHLSKSRKLERTHTKACSQVHEDTPVHAHLPKHRGGLVKREHMEAE